jgi:predicted small secreted protein
VTGPPSKENAMIRKVILALVAGCIALGATACNTVKGAGRDVESVGEAADRALGRSFVTPAKAEANLPSRGRPNLKIRPARRFST